LWFAFADLCHAVLDERGDVAFLAGGGGEGGGAGSLDHEVAAGFGEVEEFVDAQAAAVACVAAFAAACASPQDLAGLEVEVLGDVFGSGRVVGGAGLTDPAHEALGHHAFER